MFGYLLAKDLCHFSGIHIGQVFIIPVFGDPIQNQLMQPFVAFKVVLYCLKELVHSSPLLRED